ncbi:MAG TPA: hypothetical protein DG577_08840 [Firmicutes bacterium]|jgi:restriction endonuclease Mrr/uncharacterized membrane protein YciS (DUF1049 family)|nr:hypothetical protein [Bacillota bacterium]
MLEELALWAGLISLLVILGSLVWLVVSLILKKEKKTVILVLKISSATFGCSLLAFAYLPLLLVVLAIIFLCKLRKKIKVIRAEKQLKKEEERRVKDKMIEDAVDLLFQKDGLKSKLHDFILHHTKRYDLGEINQIEYNNLLGLLLRYYIQSETVKADGSDRDIYWNTELDIPLLENQIKKEKINVYANDMKKYIDINEYETVEDLVVAFLDYFGEKGLHDLNIQVLSEVAQENVDEIRQAVEKEYVRIKEQHEIQALENHLFKKDSEKKDIQYVDSLQGLEFEDFLKDLFVSFGYSHEDLPYSNDYGADLIIRKGFRRIVIQAKNYQGTVGNKAVQEVISAKIYYKCDTAMVITNSFYTTNAIKTALASGVILIDRNGLEKILREGSMYFNSLVS